MKLPRYRSAIWLGYWGFLTAIVLAGSSRSSQAIEVMAKNGMALQGKVGNLSSVAENPLVVNVPVGGVDVKQIVVLDDGLRRTFISQYQLQLETLRESDPQGQQRIRIRQRVARGGKRVGLLSAILHIEPFDQWGRRTFSVMTPKGQLDIVQGITEITPVWTRVEGLLGESSIEWDMRIATSSIPRETLSRILRNQEGASSAEGRLNMVRLLFESERYLDAQEELKQAMQEFPELADLKQLLEQLKQASARRLLSEIQLRREAGQHQRVRALLQNFPEQGVAEEILEQVREHWQAYQTAQKQGEFVLESLKQLSGKLAPGEQREQIEAIQTEIERELNINSLGRLTDYLRLADDATMSDERKLSLLISGWLLGAGNAIDNLAATTSLIEVRPLVRRYLRSKNPDERREILRLLGEQEGGTPDLVAKLLAQMKPPFAPEDPQPKMVPGHFRFEVDWSSAGDKAAYEVQLPEQYDPARRYPTIVSLHAAGRSPSDQIDWWAGAYSEEHKMRLGQATRHGYIVIAPQWARPSQTQYEYSAREHAIVLSSLRDAMRRFSIDTDRVFLSGHSAGGDAAWDIALAHPDLWAGAIPIVAVADQGDRTSPKYVSQYWENAKYVPLYFVTGELDGNKMMLNARDFDRYMTRTGFDTMVVEYLGRGHEHFYDEIHRLFTWMNLERHRRDFYPDEIKCVTMRPWDNFFWCLELGELPARSSISPYEWPAPGGIRPAETEVSFYPNNRITLQSSAERVNLFLAPDWVDLNQTIELRVRGKLRRYDVPPSLDVLLEDVRTRGDRLHPFWAKLEVDMGRRH